MIKYQTLILAAALLLPLVLCCGDPNCKSCPTNTNICESCKIGYSSTALAPLLVKGTPLLSMCLQRVFGYVACTKRANTYAVNTAVTLVSAVVLRFPFCDKCKLNGNNFVCKECMIEAVLKC